MVECYNIVRQNFRADAKRQSRQYETRIVENQYKVGDIVYLKQGAFNKLDGKYFGPYVVTKLSSLCIYEIEGNHHFM